MTQTFKNLFGRLAACATAFIAAPAFAQDGGMVGKAVPWELGLQTPASPMKERMEWFHNSLLLPMAVVVAVFVMLLLLFVMIRFNHRANPVPSKTTHNTMLEVIWTLVPVLILVVIVIPSMKMLYYVDKTQEADMTLKITGYQWYWGYEYPDHGGVNFLSNIVPDKEIKEGQVRLLSTDNVVVLPVDTNIRLLMTASDVIHSWAVPAFGVKMDAVPGRTNETWVRIDKEGTFYGQCSELCGTNHGFMPIEVHAVSKAAFAAWVHEHKGKMPEEIKAEADAKAASEKKAADEANAKEKKAVESAKTPVKNDAQDATKKALEAIPPKPAGEKH